MKKSDIETRPLRLAGELLTGTLFMAYALSTLGYFFGIAISWATLPAAFAATAAIAYAAKGNMAPRTFFITAASVAVFAALTALAASRIYDFSYDGNEYHQEIVAALAGGWNPLRPETLPPDVSLWTRHYAKALETIAADIVALSGSLEAGKAVNLWLAAAAALLTFDFTRRRFASLSHAKAVWITTLAIGNPVVLCQLPTFYIDFAKYLYTLIAIEAIVDIAGHAQARRAAATLFAVTSLAIGTKFNAFFEIGVVYIAALAWMAARRRRRTLFVTAAIGATALIAGMALSYHPYVTNTLATGHPLYPLMGEGKEDIMTGNTPHELRDNNRVTNFALSIVTVEVPTVDSRLGGFGPLFAAMLAVALCVAVGRRRSYGGVPIYITCWTVASCFFFEQSWWARYITQLWMLVPLSALLSATGSRRKRPRAFTAQAVMWSATALICSGSIAFRSVRLTVYRNAIFAELSGRSVVMTNQNEGYRRQLADSRIVIADSLTNDPSLKPLPYYGRLSEPDRFPVLYLTREQRDAIVARLRQSPFKYSKTLNELTDPK